MGGRVILLMLTPSEMVSQGGKWGIASWSEASCSPTEQHAFICDFKSQHALRSACYCISCRVNSNSLCCLL